eukprot:1440269-Rhodomonas_salina.2
MLLLVRSYQVSSACCGRAIPFTLFPRHMSPSACHTLSSALRTPQFPLHILHAHSSATATSGARALHVQARPARHQRRQPSRRQVQLPRQRRAG